MDPIITIENIIQSSEYIEKFNVKVVLGAQHFPHQQKPTIVNQAILNFLMGKLFDKLLSIALCSKNKLYFRCNKTHGKNTT